MLKKIGTTLLLLILILPLAAKEKKVYFYKKAIILSAFVPGAGELYLKKYTKASILLASELTVILGYSRMNSQATWAEHSYKDLAYSKAGMDKKLSKDYYSLASKWRSSEEYNEYLEMQARNYYLLYNNDPDSYKTFLKEHQIPEDKGWTWRTNDDWVKYRKYRIAKQDYKIYANLVASGFVLNRLFSILDSVISIKKFNKRGRLSASVNLRKKGIKIKYAYKF